MFFSAVNIFWLFIMLHLINMPIRLLKNCAEPSNISMNIEHQKNNKKAIYK